MDNDFSNTQPIYMQLVQRICRQITRHEVQPGEKLSSVRDLAVQFGVNPNTIQRVNMELERMGLIESRRGQGMFVTESTERLADLRESMKEEQMSRFITEMSELGYRDNQIIDSLQAYLFRQANNQDR